MPQVFLEVMRARAEKGEPRAVHMLYQQLLPSVQQLGCPPMQLRLQLAVEYGFDPLTQQVGRGGLAAAAAGR